MLQIYADAEDGGWMELMAAATALVLEQRQLKVKIEALEMRIATFKAANAADGGGAHPDAVIASVRSVGDSITWSEQLTLVCGIDPETACRLNGVGINAFKDLAALTPDDVDQLGRILGDRRRISAQGWIEQAALLARGIETAFAHRVRAGRAAVVQLSTVRPPQRIDLAARTERRALGHRAPIATASTRARRSAQSSSRVRGGWLVGGYHRWKSLAGVAMPAVVALSLGLQLTDHASLAGLIAQWL